MIFNPLDVVFPSVLVKNFTRTPPLEPIEQSKTTFAQMFVDDHEDKLKF